MLETKPEVRGQRSGCPSNICPALKALLRVMTATAHTVPIQCPSLASVASTFPPFTLLHSLPILKVAKVSPKCPCIKGLVSRVALM